MMFRSTIQSLLRWMRVVLPHGGAVGICVGTVLAIEAIRIFSLLTFGQVEEPLFGGLRLFTLSIFALVYGVYRAIAFHPAINEDYCQWLKSTPWNHRIPLPAGPITHVPQDLVVVAVMMLMAQDTTVKVLYIPTFFMVSYLILIGLITRFIGDWLFAYLIGFGIGGILYTPFRPEVSIATALACYPIAHLAIWRSLVRFPWDHDWKSLKKQFSANLEEKTQDLLGWPWDTQTISMPKPIVPYHDGVCLDLLLGWYVFVIQSISPSEIRGLFCVKLITGVGIASIGRVSFYFQNHRPPINFWGRIMTRQWIIPKYDSIFVAPMLAVVLNLMCQSLAIYYYAQNAAWRNPVIAIWSQLGLTFSVGGFMLSVLILTTMGPNVERWRLTGSHRIVFSHSMGGKNSKSPFIEL
ncbi:MAG: hypothetical protein FJ267_09065 [Planctomycetes bacterium]|nr:hypothetical protein [Planctomycetota bacterium]